MVKFTRLLMLCSLGMMSAAFASDKLPAVSHDGLHLLPDTKVRAAYMEPGADLGEYDKVAILDVYVSFRKNWQRDTNRESAGAVRVSDKDMKRIREAVATEFERVFREELSVRGGHELVSEGGAGVLVLRPAIVNLDVTAPDTMAAARSRTFTTSAGQMTLYLELYDGATGAIIARVIDPKALDNGMIQYSNRVTNKAEADRIFRRWASLLNDHLGAVRKTAN